MSRAGRRRGRARRQVIRTPLFRVKAGVGSKIFLDADARGGSIVARVRDDAGRVIPGFSYQDSAPITDAGGSLLLDWYRAADKKRVDGGLADLALLNGQLVRIEFRLHRARLNGFRIEVGSEPTVRIADGTHLFVDDYLVAAATGVSRRVVQPERIAVPLISGTDEQPVAGGTMVYDQQRSRFRLWHWMGGAGTRTRIVHRESSDAMTWTSRADEVFRHSGFGSKILEDREVDQEDRRFKTAYFVLGQPPLGMCVAFSSDGFSWIPAVGNPVLPYYPPGHRLWARGVGDIIDPFWDPINRRFGAFVKLFSKSDREFRRQSRTMPPGLGVRLTGLTTSQDFVHWEQPRRVFVPDRRDDGVTEFYGAEVLARDDLLIAFLRVLRDDLPADHGGAIQGIGYTVLATSRDGRTWERQTEPFLNRSSEGHTPDHAIAWITSALPYGQRVFLVYSAYEAGHKVGRRHCALAAVPRDRYIGREANQAGVLTTPLLCYTGRLLNELSLNADARRGSIRVQLKDTWGRPIPGYTFSECLPLTGDRVDMPVRYGCPLALAGGTPFRLEFLMENATIYGFSVGCATEAASGQ